MDTMTPGCLALFLGVVACYIIGFAVWSLVDAIRSRRNPPDGTVIDVLTYDPETGRGTGRSSRQR